MPLLSNLNSAFTADMPLTVNKKPNGAIILNQWIIKNQLDSERPALNLGCYTGRDLDWLLPICRPQNKEIECVDSWWWVLEEEKKLQVCREVETLYSDPLVQWSWCDFSEAKNLRSADFIWMCPSYWYPIEHLFRETNHACVWGFSNMPWLFERMCEFFAYKRLHLLYFSATVSAVTNDDLIYEQWMDSIDTISPLLEKHGQRLDRYGDVAAWRLNEMTGMDRFAQFINSQP